MFTFSSCLSSSDSISDNKSKQSYEIERIDDSTICYSYNVSNNEKDMIYVCKADTIANVRFSETEMYENHVFYDKNKNKIKIKQCLKPIGIEERINNESVYFKDNGIIDTSDSRILFCEVIGDSIRIYADNKSFYNKTRILIGDTNVFDIWVWKNPIKFESKSSFLTIPNSFKGKKCVFQRISTDKKGEDESGYDIYFETENIICRDVTKSLVYFPEK